MPNQVGLIELVEGLPRSRVVLVGDLMLDRYLYGNAERLSPEAPVPVLHFQREELRLGGAGGVAANLATLGADVRVVGVVGRDDAGKHVREHLHAFGASADSLVEADDRPTVSKVRLVGLAQHRHPQQMMRLDFEEHGPLTRFSMDSLATTERTFERIWAAVTSSQRQTSVSPSGWRKESAGRFNQSRKARPISSRCRRWRTLCGSGRRASGLSACTAAMAARRPRSAAAVPPAMPAPSPATAMPGTELPKSWSSTGWKQS